MTTPDTPDAPLATPAPVAGPSPAQQARVVLKELQQQYPAFRDCKPLAIGIDKQLQIERPEISRKTLRIALGIHTHSLRYLKAMEKATHRFTLAGEQADEVSDEHRAHAAEAVRERQQKNAELRKVQRKQEETQRKQQEAQRKQEQAEHQREEKLNQLTAKFGRG